MSDTTGWTRIDGDEYRKVINGYLYRIWRRTTGFFPGGWVVQCEGETITPKCCEPTKLALAKRLAHRHAEGTK